MTCSQETGPRIRRILTAAYVSEEGCACGSRGSILFDDCGTNMVSVNAYWATVVVKRPWRRVANEETTPYGRGGSSAGAHSEIRGREERRGHQDDAADVPDSGLCDLFPRPA